MESCDAIHEETFTATTPAARLMANARNWRTIMRATPRLLPRCIVVFVVMFWIFLTVRSSGLYPAVFADEYVYSKFARFTPLAEATIPGYLYLALYRGTVHCGDGFLGCARMMNALFFVMAVPFIYFIAKRVASEKIACLVAVLAVLGPTNTYTAYFMPESLYFLGFWIFCWCLLRLEVSSPEQSWFWCGMVFAALALVKPHALFLVPAVLAYVFILFNGWRRCNRGPLLKACGCILAGAVVVRYGLGYALGGPGALGLFGSTYGEIASSTMSRSEELARFVLSALHNAKGHALALALIHGLPIVVAAGVAGSLVRRQRSRSGDDADHGRLTDHEKVACLALLVVVTLVGVVALFTASVAARGESIDRLHMRYYDFALPMLFLLAAGALNQTVNPKPRTSRVQERVLGMVCAVMALYALWRNVAPFVPSLVDNPGLFGLYTNRTAFVLTGVLLIFSIILWICSARKGLQFHVWIVWPCAVLVSGYFSGKTLTGRLDRDDFDRAGIFVRQVLPANLSSRLVVAGSEAAGLFRTLFYVDNPDASLEVLSPRGRYDLNNLPEGKDWLLTVGDHEVVGRPLFQMSMNGFSLIRAVRKGVISFRNSEWPDPAFRVTGLSGSESWGTWSDSDEVSIGFPTALPLKFEVEIAGHAFGPNVGREIVASVGGAASATFSFPSAARATTVFRLENPEGSNQLRLHIPAPTSPQSLGLSGDARRLGIGLVEMRITPL